MEQLANKIIETNRILLRPFITEDSEPMYRNWASDSKVTEYLTWTAHQNIDETRYVVNMWVEESCNIDNYHWAIVLKDINEPIGSIGIIEFDKSDNSAVIGYCMGSKWWGQGIMPEALNSVIEYLFKETDIEKIKSYHSFENLKSGRVMQKVGMKYTGEGKAVDNKGQEVVTICYEINKNDTQILIKIAEKRHISGLCKLLHQVCNVHHNGRPDLFKLGGIKYSEAQLEDMVKSKDNPIFVAVDKNENVLGYAFCITKQFLNDGALTDIKTLYIDDICIDEKYRGKSIGSRIFRFVKDYAKEHNYYNLTLNVWSCNPGAEEFYKKCGLMVQKTGMECIL
ncbi:MAG: GNAT family N-acetyltransferase [Ruminococcus sp.]|nr:GNAT family N-acetyltransferase [Ruminococcus sp.]